ncbi:MAG: hypothetical protein LBJ69_03420, partial [Holosporales bacterium]|nr:hypothetical protein [Holosporales bacterium]
MSKCGNRLARRAAVQFMYQVDMLGENDPGQLDRFITHYIDGVEEFAEMSVPLFRKLVMNFAESLDAAEIIRSNLTEGKD